MKRLLKILFLLSALNATAEMLVDDIRDCIPGRTKWRFHTELDYTYKYDITDWAHNFTGFGVYFK